MYLIRSTNAGGGEILYTCTDRPWGPPSPLYNGYQVFLEGRGCRGVGLTTTPSSSAEVLERVELYLYSP